MRAAFLLRKCKFYFYTAGLIPAVFLSVSCQCVEDWLDRNKPLPDTGLTGAPQAEKKTYTVDEAAAFFCNHLIMKFSMHYNGKPYLLWNKEDRRIRKIAMQLYKDNVVTQWKNSTSEQCLIRTEKYFHGEWHLIALDQKKNQVILSLRLPIKD